MGAAGRVEALVRGSLYAVAGLEPFCLAVWLVSGRAAGLAPAGRGALVAVGAVHTALCVLLLRRGLAHRLGREPRPGRLVCAVLTVGVAGGALVLGLRPGSGAEVGAAAAVAFCAGPVLIALPLRQGLGYTVAALAAVCAVGAGMGLTRQQLVVLLEAGVVAGTLFGLDGRLSAWRLAVLWELDAARESQSRLAVAEERLRFARDLHDVMGRNLAAIALKSELAAALAERGKPDAVGEMRDVQRIAVEAQQEVRGLVRGYRVTDLRTELSGARSVLRAAGIDCGVTEEGGGAGAVQWSAEAQSALGWVVREGVTNVLRHSDAARCRISLRADGLDGVAVEIVNDRARPRAAGPGAGSGLAGLTERIEAVGGSLTARHEPDGRFRLLATVPAMTGEAA
jgi:two-component system sensor histidine kinase DesK